MSLFALIFGSLLRYRETNLLNLADVWLRALYYKRSFDYVLSWIALQSYRGSPYGSDSTV